MEQSNGRQSAVRQEHASTIVAMPAFAAVGLRWEGTFAEAGAGSIRAVHKQLQERLDEIPNRLPGEHFCGLSYHAVPGGQGFVHYAAVEVAEAGELPAGMAALEVPALTYARCDHRKGQSIDRSYQNIYGWIESQGYRVANTELTHFERYPIRQDPYSDDPEFTIMIPVEKA